MLKHTVISRALIALLTAIGVTAPGRPAAAQDPCALYAQQTAALQMQAEEGACGFGGAQWQGGYADHYQWCRTHPQDQLRALTDWRRSEIARCRGTVTVAPQMPQPLTVLPLARPSQPAAPQPAAVPGVESLVNRLDARLGARQQAPQIPAHVVGLYQPPDVTALLPKPLVMQGADAQLRDRYRSVFDGARSDRRDVHLPPRIDSVLVAPSSSQKIAPGSVLLITGGNFGAQPGRAYLRFLIGPETESRMMSGKGWEAAEVELQPFNPTWAESWFSNVIMARAVHTFDHLGLAADRQGELVVALPDGSSDSETMTLTLGGPVISEIRTPRGYGIIRPGDRVEILGSRFGDTRGAVTLNVDPGLKKIWQKAKGLSRYVYWSPMGMREKAGPDFQPALTVMSWTDTRIEFQANLVLSAMPKGGDARLWVQTASGQVARASDALYFGPETVTRPVSGIAWLEQETRPSAHVTEGGGAMIVTHKPDCGAFDDSGEKGVDWFFVESGWPEDIEIMAFDFAEIDPDDPYGSVDFFSDQVTDLLNALASGPLGWAKYVGERALDAIVGGGSGGYGAYVSRQPGGHAWNTYGSRAISVRWESDCVFGERPVSYAVSFTINGTPQAVARY